MCIHYADDHFFGSCTELGNRSRMSGFVGMPTWQPLVKVVLWSRGSHLTKPGWSKPHIHSNPTNLALFRHKITLYRFKWGGGGLMLLQGAQMGAGGWAPRPPPLTLTTAGNPTYRQTDIQTSDNTPTPAY